MRLLLIVLGLISGFSYGATINSKIHIVGDSMTTSQGTKFAYLSFSETRNFSQKNARVELQIGDELNLWVVNLDSVEHVFDIKGFNLDLAIPANDSILYNHTFSIAGSYIYYCSKDYPKYSYLGLSGMLIVKDHDHASFYWNIKDHNAEWNNLLINGTTVNWSNYDPKFFTVNGFSNPDINTDADARITGQVGDTLIIYMTNTGSAIHPIHLHGYHAEVISSSKFPHHIGRVKDSQGVYPFETIVLKLVPHQPGEYPIHDHNLIATTGGDLYPYGMLSTILIMP